jgi:hypothetical protein
MARRRRERYEQVALEEGQRAGVRNPYAFLRQVRQEAHGEDLTSPAGAQGPAQFMPATARSVGLSSTQVHQLRPSYRAAAKLMAGYERQYGSTRKALIAYNAGPGRVNGPLPAETQDYIRRILPNGEKVVRGNVTGQVSRTSATAGTSRFTGGTAGTRTVRSTRDVTEATFDQAGYDQAVRKQKVAQLLRSSGRGNSVLFRSGLLSANEVDPTGFQGTATRQVTTSRQVRIPGTETVGAAAPSSDTIKTAIHAANNRLGITETAGSNRGPEVDKMQRSFGMVGQPWCGIYVGTVLRRAGVKVDSRVASVAEIETMARAKTGGFEGGWHSAKHARAGDALVTRRGQHVAFVKSVDRDGTIHVIGGNQGNGAVTEGSWRPDQVYGVARPSYR